MIKPFGEIEKMSADERSAYYREERDRLNKNRVSQLSEELKDWRNEYRNTAGLQANESSSWTGIRDFDGKQIITEFPQVTTLEEAAALADQGQPCWMLDTENNTKYWGPAVLYKVTQSVVQERENAEAMQKAKESIRLKGVADMLKTPEIEWLVDGKIHRAGLCQIFGESYAGKTLLVLDLAMSWAAGLPEWQGYKLNNNGEAQHVVYVAAEGGAALSVHVDAWLKHHKDVDPSRLDGLLFLDGGDGDHMFLGIGKTEVDDTDSWDRLKLEMDLSDIKPSLMIFDTQIDLAPGVDENSNTDMVGVLRTVKNLGDKHKFMAIVVHHTGHDGNKARGASGMKGKCDVQAKLTVIGTKAGKAKLEWTKVKGMALPEDTISYEIMGKAKMPELNSEGAVCVPITKLAAAIAEHVGKEPVSPEGQRRYMLPLVGKRLNLREYADAVGVDRNTKAFKETIEWLLEAQMIQKEVVGKAHYFTLGEFAVVPQDPSIDD